MVRLLEPLGLLHVQAERMVDEAMGAAEAIQKQDRLPWEECLSQAKQSVIPTSPEEESTWLEANATGPKAEPAATTT